MDIDLSNLEDALRVLGQLLEERGCRFEIVAIGGGSLLLLGQIDRTTKDIDVLALMDEARLISADPLPEVLIQSAIEVGRAMSFGKDWFNIGPASLIQFGLPNGFLERLHTKDYRGLVVHLADRYDQIHFKLYACVDQGPDSKHFFDLVALKPSEHELQKAKQWCFTHDTSSSFRDEMNKALECIRAKS